MLEPELLAVQNGPVEETEGVLDTLRVGELDVSHTQLLASHSVPGDGHLL